MGYVFVGAILLLPIPVYVVGRKTGVGGLWILLIPIIGPPAVLLRCIGVSAWWVLTFFVGGGFVIYPVTGWKMPRRHERTRWWSLGLMIPLLNCFVYWPYAFTLPDRRADPAQRAPKPRRPPAAASSPSEAHTGVDAPEKLEERLAHYTAADKR